MVKAKVAAERSNGGSFGFDRWGLDARDQFDKLIGEMIREGLELATKEYKCEASFAIEFGGSPADPTTVDVELPVGASDEGDNPSWSFTLTDLVTCLIERNERGDEAVIDADARPQVELLRDAFRALADRLDGALARP